MIRSIWGCTARMIQLALFLLLIPLFWALLVEAYPILLQHWDSTAYPLIFAGAFCYLLYFLAIQKLRGALWNNHEFIKILRHELAHALTALLLLVGVREIHVANPRRAESNVAGYVSYNQKPGCGFIISLAPYFLPLFTIPFFILKLFSLGPQIELFVDFMIGFTLAFHFMSIIRELSIRQSDTQKLGCFLSYALIILANLFLLVIVKSLIQATWLLDKAYFQTVWERSQVYYGLAWDVINRLIDLILSRFI